MNVYLHGLGCDKNTVDGEVLLGSFSDAGFDVVDDPASADYIVINTCCFIESAKVESIEAIFSLLPYKESGAKLVVSGCMAQRYREELRDEIPEIDYIISSVEELDQILGFKTLKERYIKNSASAYLKIADGCDRNCTYCVIPSIKGRNRSKPIPELVDEARRLRQNGVEELILVAQDITQYGNDTDASLIGVLEELVKVGFKWIRLLYLYPEGIDRELLEFIRDNETVLPYFDLPIQHTNDYILKRMGRNISKAEIFEKVALIRELLPKAVLRSTVIVGFPGESESAFREMLSDLKRLRFDRLGVFEYSREEGTPAYRMPDQISREIKNERSRDLKRLQQEIMSEQNQRFLGNTYPVLIEERIDETTYSGRLYADAPEIDCIVYINSDGELTPGTFRDVKILSALDYEFIGDLNESS